jgi:hypothetical protein
MLMTKTREPDAYHIYRQPWLLDFVQGGAEGSTEGSMQEKFGRKAHAKNPAINWPIPGRSVSTDHTVLKQTRDITKGTEAKTYPTKQP